MNANISPYGYDLSMLAVVNAACPHQEAEPAESVPTAVPTDKACVPPKDRCPFLELPYELRAQILAYVLPCTISSPVKEVIWLRGNTAVFATCQALNAECKRIMYQDVTILVDVHFDRIIFNYQWLIATDITDTRFVYGQNVGPEDGFAFHSCHDLVPSRKTDFLAHFPAPLRRSMRKFFIRLHLADDYEGMIKYNTGNEEALSRGLIERLELFCRETRRDCGGDSENMAREVSITLWGSNGPLSERFQKRVSDRLNQIKAGRW